MYKWFKWCISDMRSVSDWLKARGYPCAKGYNSSASQWLSAEQVRLFSGHPKVHFGTIVEGSLEGGGEGYSTQQQYDQPWSMHPLRGKRLPKPTWAGWTKSRKNMVLRVKLRAMKTNLVHHMETTANVEPFERRSLRILIQGEKVMWLPSHPLHTNPTQPTKNLLKRQRLNHQYKELQKTPRHCGCAQIAADRSCLEAQ